MRTLPLTTTLTLCLLAAPAWACGPSSWTELILFVLIIAAVKLGLPLAACWLVYRLFVWVFGADAPLPGKVTVLSERALSLRQPTTV